MTEAVPGFRGHIAYQAILLGGFAMAAAALLAFSDRQTAEPIRQRQAEDLRTSLSQVVPGERHDNDMLADTLTAVLDGAPVTVYRATREGQVTAVAFETVGWGYGGEIRVVVGLDPAGEILGTRVIKHSETPGLGDKIEAEKSDWILAFTGLSLDNTASAQWAVKKDGGRFDQFSGATITPRAVVGAVKRGLAFFADNRDALLAPAPAPVSHAPAPASDTPAPVPDMPTPVSDTPTPVPYMPTPVLDTPTPVLNTPTPVLNTKEPRS